MTSARLGLSGKNSRRERVSRVAAGRFLGSSNCGGAVKSAACQSAMGKQPTRRSVPVVDLGRK